MSMFQIFNRTNRRDLKQQSKEDSEVLLSDASLAMTRLVQEVSLMEIRSNSIANRLAALENGSARWKHRAPCEANLLPLSSSSVNENVRVLL